MYALFDTDPFLSRPFLSVCRWSLRHTTRKRRPTRSSRIAAAAEEPWFSLSSAAVWPSKMAACSAMTRPTETMITTASRNSSGFLKCGSPNA